MEAGTFRLCYANRATRRRLRSVLGARAVPAQQTDDVEIEKKKGTAKETKKVALAGWSLAVLAAETRKGVLPTRVGRG